MDVLLRYRGREVFPADVGFIQELIDNHPNESRRKLSKTLCEAWGWVQSNGQLRDMVCRGLMLELHRRGLIRLPPKRHAPPNPFLQRLGPKRIEVACDPLVATLKKLGPVELRQVRRSAEESLVNSPSKSGRIHGKHTWKRTRIVDTEAEAIAYLSEIKKLRLVSELSGSEL